MSISPGGLNAVGTNPRNSSQLKRSRCKRLLRPFVNVAHDIHLAFAAGARAMAAQFFQRDKSLGAIVPLDGQLVADGLNIERLHSGCLSAFRRKYCDVSTPGEQKNKKLACG